MPTDALKAREKIPEGGTFDLSLFDLSTFSSIRVPPITGLPGQIYDSFIHRLHPYEQIIRTFPRVIKRACQSIEIQKRLRPHLETAR